MALPQKKVSAARANLSISSQSFPPARLPAARNGVQGLAPFILILRSKQAAFVEVEMDKPAIH